MKGSIGDLFIKVTQDVYEACTKLDYKNDGVVFLDCHRKKIC